MFKAVQLQIHIALVHGWYYVAGQCS